MRGRRPASHGLPPQAGHTPLYAALYHYNYTGARVLCALGADLLDKTDYRSIRTLVDATEMWREERDDARLAYEFMEEHAAVDRYHF